MKKFAAAIARNKGIKAPAGYTKSAAVCRAFLDGYAPKRGSGEDAIGRTHDAPRAAALQQDLPDDGVRADAEIGSRPRGIDERVRGAPRHATFSADIRLRGDTPRLQTLR